MWPLALVLTLLAAPVDRSAVGAPHVQELEFNTPRDALLLGTSALFWISSETFLKNDLAPANCRWCDQTPDGVDTTNPVDRWGRRLSGSTATRDRAQLWSNVIDFAVLPAAVLGAQFAAASHDGHPRMFLEDGTIIFQSAALAAVLNQTAKFAFGRQRPFIHDLPQDGKRLTARPNDNNLSFYSGHTSMAFSLVVAAGTVAELRDYRYHWLVWSVGLPLAASIPLLRMTAERHYLTDVAVGAVVGSAVGFLVPTLLHGRSGPAATAQVQVSPRGASVSARF